MIQRNIRKFVKITLSLFIALGKVGLSISRQMAMFGICIVDMHSCKYKPSWIVNLLFYAFFFCFMVYI